MNISTSECSSGGESGWTTYFDQISNSNDQYNNTSMPLDQYDYRINKGKYVNQAEEQKEHEEDEDLSMVSDASSGPPHLHQEQENSENTRYITAISGLESKKGKNKNKEKIHRRTESLNFHLDDTASSPAFNFSKNNAALEHDKSLTYYHHHSGVPATHLKGKSVLEKHFRFFKP